MPETIPQNGHYMVAAYTIAAVILLVYTLMLFRRSRRVS